MHLLLANMIDNSFRRLILEDDGEERRNYRTETRENSEIR